MEDSLKHIPTNIITGFLGAGKSTAILNLLRQKPNDERWAVLVNEFGEIGIDGGLLSGNQRDGIFIREVPGGCMCCASGLPMQIAMNMLLARARPQRLLIEPTGLGHPVEVMSVLAADYYQELLDLRATITLVDARKIRDSRYRSHETFKQQLAIADVIVASKQDLYGPDDLSGLEDYLTKQDLLADRALTQSQDGDLSIDWLAQPARAWALTPTALSKPDIDATEPAEIAYPPEGFVYLSNHGEGFESHGWKFLPSFRFSRPAALELFQTLDVERFKAVLKTSDGDWAYNYAGDSLDQTSLTALEDSRIEVITSKPFDAKDFEAKLLALTRLED